MVPVDQIWSRILHMEAPMHVGDPDSQGAATFCLSSGFEQQESVSGSVGKALLLFRLVEAFSFDFLLPFESSISPHIV